MLTTILLQDKLAAVLVLDFAAFRPTWQVAPRCLIGLLPTRYHRIAAGAAATTRLTSLSLRGFCLSAGTVFEPSRVAVQPRRARSLAVLHPLGRGGKSAPALRGARRARPLPRQVPVCVYVCEDEEGGYRKDVIALCVDPTSSY